MLRAPSCPSRSAIRFAFVACTILGALGATATDSAAKSKKEASYPYEQVWPTAVRFLRLDEGVAIVEKDGAAGYLVFELSDDRKTFRGALELVRIKDHAGRDAVRMYLRIENRPSYMELGILNRLHTKLVKELGQPAPPPSRKPTPKPTPTPEPDKPDEPGSAPADRPKN